MRKAIGALTLAIALGALACSTVEDDLVTDIGVAQVVILDPDLAPQVVGSSLAPTIQAASWVVSAASLTVGSNSIDDLTFGDSICAFFDGSAIAPTGDGKCARGFVLDADGQTRTVELQLTFTASFRRARPFDLPETADFDGDGVPNGVDNCPLIDNPDQADTGGLGFGDACGRTNPLTGLRSLDSDRDGFADASDNCVQVPNPTQENDDPAGEEFGGRLGLNDGIGNACEMQTAQVSATLTLGPEDLLQVRERASFLTVDFSYVESLVCDWSMGVCTLDPSQVRFCVTVNPVGGCA